MHVQCMGLGEDLYRFLVTKQEAENTLCWMCTVLTALDMSTTA